MIARGGLYLDHNASTPVDPAVAAAMMPYLEGGWGNPSSAHWAGTPAKNAIALARAQVAEAIGAAPDEIVFTSGGSEANNSAIKGAYFARRDRGTHIVTSAVEHPAVIEPCRYLERFGASVTYLPVDGDGAVDPADLERAIRDDTILVTIMHANNEVGTVQPIAECARIARAHGAVFHSDAAQSLGKIPVDVGALGIDLLSIAGHKVYAPKGIGALYVRRGTLLEPMMHGAGHEGGRRAGTESALLAVALGSACTLARDLSIMDEVRSLRDSLWASLQDALGDRIVVNGSLDNGLPNTLNVSFVGCVGADLLARIPDLAASTGSACHSGRVDLSPTLRAMGLSPEVGMGAVRLSLGRATTSDEISRAIALLVGAAR